MLPLAKRKAGSPLSEEELEQRREAAKSRWSTAAKVGLGLATVAAAPLIAAGAVYTGNRAAHAAAMRAGGYAPGHTNRGASHLGLRSLWRARSEIPTHIKEMITNPTAEGKKPTGKEIRRRLARASFWGNEHAIITGDNGKVIVNKTGSINSVNLTDKSPLIDRALATERRARFYHNHPTDTPPSPADSITALGMNYKRHVAGKSPVSNYVHSYGETWDGRTRARITRYDDTPIFNRVLDDVKAGKPVQDSFAAHTQHPKTNITEAEWERAKEVQFKPNAAGGFDHAHNKQFKYRTKAVTKVHAGLPLAKGILL